MSSTENLNDTLAQVNAAAQSLSLATDSTASSDTVATEPVTLNLDFNDALSNTTVNSFPVNLEKFQNVGEDGLVKKRILRRSDGIVPDPSSTVSCEYAGFVASSGYEFDRSLAGYPFKFAMGAGKVLPGWERGIASMKSGEVAQVWMHSSLAYGETGSQDDIEPNSDLMFTIHLCGSTSGGGQGGGELDKVTLRQMEEENRLLEIRKKREEAALKRKLDKEKKLLQAQEREKERLEKLAAKANKGKKSKKKKKP